MSNLMPVVTIQYDWHEILRLPNDEVWISAKFLNTNSVHDKVWTTLNKPDKKIKINLSEAYQFVSQSNLCLVLKHVESGLKVAFVAATKAHNVHKKAVLSVGLAENALAVSSCEEDKLLVWDTRTNEALLDLDGHGGPIYKCRFFPSGIVVISAGADGSCRIWSAESGINPVTLQGHTMAVPDVCIVDKGRNVISVSKDGFAKLWDIGESKCLENLTEGQGPINCCAIGVSPEEAEVENEREIGTKNKIVVVGCENGLVIAVHVGKRQEIYRKEVASACNACTVVDQTIVMGCEDGRLVLLNLQDGAIIREIHESASPVFSMVTLTNHLFVIGRQDGNCVVISIKDEFAAVRVQLTGSDCDGIRDVAFNGKWILAACRDTYIRKYDFNQISVHFK
ncbi:proteasomal ATPase-associated factor 1 [Bicyclus anynana]|uniref:Proteasomal ATPase-associated factor 1 n=1 Tax=Bicyclus anynana TaxID=110368 RepID=A0A6J1NN45_BICAN|nr:proteasomal ATPase-associated factor 1 [Bicyclus anynana]